MYENETFKCMIPSLEGKGTFSLKISGLFKQMWRSVQFEPNESSN